MRTRRSQFSGDPVTQVLSAAKAPGGRHRAVLLQEALAALDIQKNDVVLDATLGGAGHARAITGSLGKKGMLIGFDLDADAIERARTALADATCQTHFIEANFRDLQRELETRGITRITKALFDLGWSSYQLDSGRGFSYQTDEPLLMTYSKTPGAVTAAVAVNTWEESSLADIIYGFGEERYSRRIAKAIVEHRAQRPFATSRELAEVIEETVPASYRHGRIHPATRTFQALRIAVNDELGALSQGIRNAYELLEEGGRIAVITFHSIEDRAVKQLFAEFEKEGKGKRFTPKDSKLPTGQAKKPFILPSKEEIANNRRARSAKLRVFVKASYDKETFQNKQIQALDIPGDL